MPEGMMRRGRIQGECGGCGEGGYRESVEGMVREDIGRVWRGRI